MTARECARDTDTMRSSAAGSAAVRGTVGWVNASAVLPKILVNQVCIFRNMCIHMDACRSIYVYMCIHVCICIYIHTYAYIYKYVNIYICIYTYMWIGSRASEVQEDGPMFMRHVLPRS